MSLKKAGNIVLISLSAIILILSFAVVLAFFFLDNAIASYLKDQVAKASEGQYELHIGDIKVSYINQTIILDSVYVTTSAKKLQQARKMKEKPLPDVNIDFPLIKLVNLDVSQLLTGDVHFQKFYIEQPLISIIYKEEQEKSPSNFFENLREMLPTIEAEKVLFISGDIYYLKQGSIKLLDINNLSFLFKDFSTATFSLPSAFYPSNDLVLFLEGGMKYRKGPDVFTLDNLASTPQYLLAEGISLITDSSGYELSGKTVFNIQAPFVLATLSEKKTPQKVMNLKKLILANPEIYVSAKEDRGKTIEGKVKSLPEIVSPYLNDLIIGEIQLTDADIKYVHREKDFNTLYEGTEVYASLKDFHVNPGKGIDTTDILYAEWFKLAVNGEFSMIDDMYSLTADKVVASSDTGLLVKDIRFFTKEHSTCNIQEPYIKLKAPVLHVAFSQWERLAHGKGITIPAILLKSPNIAISGLKAEEGNGAGGKSIVQFVERFVPYLKINKLTIPETNLDITLCREAENVKLAAKDLKVTLTDIKIDSAAATDPERLLFAEKAVAQLDKFRFTTGKAKVIVRDIYFNSEKGLYTGGLLVNADTEGSEFTLEAPALIVNTSQWGQMLKGQNVYIPNILLKEPDIFLTTSDGERDQADITEAITEAVPDVTIKQIHVVNADLTYKKTASQHPSTLKTRNFDLHLYDLDIPAPDPDERILFAENFELSVDNYASFSKNLYHLQVEELKASTWEGVTGKEISLSTDSSDYLQAIKTGSPTYYQVNIPELNISYIDWAALVNGDGTKTGITTIKSPDVQIIDTEEEHPPKKSLVLFHEKVNEYWPWLSSDKLSIKDGQLLFSRIKTKDTSFYVAKDFDLTLNNILIDSASAEPNERILYAANIQLEASGLERKSTDGLHVLTIDSIFAATDTEVLEAFALKYIPKDSMDEFLKQQIPQQDFLRLSAPYIKACNLNWNAFFDKGNDIIASYITGQNIEAIVIRDRTLPKKQEKNGMPHKWFRSLPARVSIDSAFFPDAYIAYKEKPGEELQEGTLWFSDVDTRIRNLNNTSNESHIAVQTEGKVMGAGELYLEVVFDIFSNKNAFTYHGEAGSMDLTKLNPALEPIGFLSIESGYLDSIDFHVDANEEHATGELMAYFDNLKIDLLKKEPDLDDKDIKSFFANALVVNSENVPGDFNPGEIAYSWDKKNNYFNYLWKTFRSGIYSSLGVKKFKKIKKKAGKILPFI